ncbi:hypothetical protein [Rhizobium sp. BK376]|uniref:hypothetical protein n=1 Tax=Rhizobium sp. BK376 TaxID=2512149 RepID=UPI00104DB2DE|nr:hypothetical protein [Rhizobium sp. BK376]TCR92178.1 hypothetical protein EV561_102623 [Rhizobium sp. BK376]
MVRPQIIVVAGMFVFGLAGVSQAAEISEQGARELRNAINHAFSQDLVKSGFIRVKPAENAYEVTFDVGQFLDKVSSSDFSITGLKPQMYLVAPLANGLWNIEQNNDGINLTMHSKFGPEPATDMTASLGPSTYSGVFDPAISYLRSANFSGKDFKSSSVTGAQATEMTAGAINSTLATIDSGEGHKVDFHISSNMSSLYNKVVAPNLAGFEFRSDSMGVEASATGVPVIEVRDLLRFLFQHIKAKTLSKKGSDRFKELVRGALPVFNHFQESVDAQGVTVTTEKGNAGIKRLNYSFQMDGITKASRIDFGVRAQDFTLADGLVPAIYAPLVPSAAELQFGIPNMNFADAVDLALHADFSKASPLSKEDSDKIGQIIFPGQNLMIDMPKLSAISSVYDVEVSGKLLANLKEKNHFSMQASILARDYDKTISFIQNVAKTDPELNKVSFSLMAAKGFAKTDPDGRQRWDITVAEDGTFTINGQVMKIPAAPSGPTGTP